jgi:tetratricopeptide (TPR) repeat protein
MKYGWLLILWLCFVVYSNSLDSSFHYDDEHSVEKNINIGSLENIPDFFRDPGLFSVDADKGMYRPLLLVSYAVNFAYGGFDTTSYHAFNILIHGCNALLVAWIARLLGASALVSLAAGLLFGVHPLAGEPVNYISSRSESLAAIFFLAGLGLFIHWNKIGGRLSRGLSLGCLVLGLLTKEMVVTLPALLIVYDWLFIAQRDVNAFGRSVLQRHASYWGIVAGFFLIIWFNGFLPRSLDRAPRDGLSQFLTQLKAVAYYLYLQVAPIKLTVEYQFFEQSQWQWALIFPLLLGLSLIALGAWLYRSRRDIPFFALVWSTVVLVPVMVMPLNIFVNERRLYLSCAAFCLGLAWILGKLQALQHKQRTYLVLGLIGICALLSWQHNPIWADDMSLWRDGVEKAPRMPRPHLYLGNAYTTAANTSRDAQAVQRYWEAGKKAYSRVIAINSNRDLSLRALNNLGSISFSLHDYSTAEVHYKKAVELDPSYADGLVNLGNINLVYARNARRKGALTQEQKSQEQAIEYYQKALAILPNHPQAYSNMGLVLFDMGVLDQAEQALGRANLLTPGDPIILFNLGRLEVVHGERAAANGESPKPFFLKARGYFQKSAQANPAYGMPREALIDLDKRLGQYQ